MIRAFLAVELSQELRAEVALVQQELKGRIEPRINLNRHIGLSPRGETVQPSSGLGEDEDGRAAYWSRIGNERSA